MAGMRTKWFSERITYTGAELAPHWISARTQVFESAIVGFRGECKVASGEMVDLEDSRTGKFIASGEMLHFLGEWFEGSLELAVARQRLLIAGFAELLRERLPAEQAHGLIRRGNDLYLYDSRGSRQEPAKLSVSIVTATPVSTLFHFGVNIDPSGAPVKAVGLAELGVDPESLALATLQSWKEEWDGMAKARCKVAPR
jgi:hypothetical protein